MFLGRLLEGEHIGTHTMGRSKKSDSGASWEAVSGGNGIPTPSKGKNALKEGGKITTEKGDIFAGQLRGQFALA
jgi:hypothetical protein